MNGKVVEPTPAQFDSYEEAARFWDTHDTTDYLDEFRIVEPQDKLRAHNSKMDCHNSVMRNSSNGAS